MFSSQAPQDPSRDPRMGPPLQGDPQHQWQTPHWAAPGIPLHRCKFAPSCLNMLAIMPAPMFLLALSFCCHVEIVCPYACRPRSCRMGSCFESMPGMLPCDCHVTEWHCRIIVALSVSELSLFELSVFELSVFAVGPGGGPGAGHHPAGPGPLQVQDGYGPSEYPSAHPDPFQPPHQAGPTYPPHPAGASTFIFTHMPPCCFDFSFPHTSSLTTTLRCLLGSAKQ